MADPFAVLEVEPTFALDLVALEKRHRDLSRALHPDRFTGRSAGERRQAIGRAIEVNEAYRVLKDPVKRARALLHRRGHEQDEEASGTVEPALLMQVMERREALSEARRAGDLGAVRRLAAEVAERERRLESELGATFAAEPLDVAAVEKALAELRYHRRFSEEAGTALDELE